MKHPVKKHQFNTPFLNKTDYEGGEGDLVKPSSQGLDMKENADSGYDVTNANIYRSDRKFWTIFIQNKGLTTELALTGFLLLTF